LRERSWTEIAARLAELPLPGEPIRLIVAAATADTLTLESSFLVTERPPAWPSLLSVQSRARGESDAFVVMCLVPTGMRAEIGGFAGDATPTANLLALACDALIVNPNVVTASDLYLARDNVWYLEGNAICRFLLGHLDLRLSPARRIGVLIEQPRSEQFLNNTLNAINAMHAVGGLDIDPVVVSDKPFSVSSTLSEFGHATAAPSDLEELCGGLDVLAAAGVDAAAITSAILVEQGVRQRYYAGEPIPNPWGAAEAVLTHAVTSLYRFPSAHAPLLTELSHAMWGTPVDPRDSAELISTSYLCSVLEGLRHSPRLLPRSEAAGAGARAISAADLSALVLPETAVGNVPFFCAIERGIPVVVVCDNPTIGRVTPAALGLAEHPRIYFVKSYLEASGLLLAMRGGIAPTSLRRPLQPIRPLRSRRARS
jgi:hypothetical protein